MFELLLDAREEKEQSMSSETELRFPNYFTCSSRFLVQFRSPKTEPTGQRPALWLLSLIIYIKMETLCGDCFVMYRNIKSISNLCCAPVTNIVL